jgi:predicted O-linked N-acetylglucosamine transferase (SPINDLY family)
MTRTRLLTPSERRVLVDALRRAASETRATSSAAANRCAPLSANPNHVDALSKLAQAQDRLAAELAEYEVRLEKR